jgi:pyruvate dehydrogenase E2 component (dihydrolipoamide acetyltransferase)
MDTLQMAKIVIMPKQGQSVESCIITKWHKKVGDQVEMGDILFSYETDKAAFDEEAREAGTFLAAFAEEEEDVPCLNPVCVIGEQGEDISGIFPQKESKKDKTMISAGIGETRGETKSPQEKKNQRVFISPRAREAARRQGVVAQKAMPSGPNGRIIERDIYKYSAEAILDKDEKEDTEVFEGTTATAEYTDEVLSNVRKVIAKSMHASLASMAQLTNQSSFDATKILDYRKSIKERNKNLDMEDITLNDMILFAVSRVLKNHPSLNAHFLEDKIRYFHSVNLGIAVDTPRGLLVPTIFNAEKKSLNQISKETKELIKAAQTARIAPDLLQNATFTVTNLGALGVESFTPIINPPQTAILGICAAVLRMKQINGEMKNYPAMGISLTYDHRAVDGAPAAKFAQELAGALENFDLMLAK